MDTLKVILLILLVAAFAVGQVPTVVEGGIIDGASFSKGQAVAPGGVVSIFGSGLAASLLQAGTIPLSTSLGNTSVTFNGVPAPLYFVSDGQINAQVPWNALSGGATAGSANVVVARGGASSAPRSVSIGPFSPGIFSIPAGEGYAIAINPDGSIAAPVGAIPGFPTRPVKAGEALIILANGLGAVTPEVSSGAAGGSTLRNTNTKPTVLIGGQSAQVAFSGLSPQFPGINQLNIVVPSVTPGDQVPLQIDIGGIRTTSKVIISVGR